jgi:hypothetical protein
LQQSSAIAGLYCIVGYALITSLDRGVNRLSVFCLGGGGVSLRAARNHKVEKIIIFRKKYQALQWHQLYNRRPSFVFIAAENK